MSRVEERESGIPRLGKGGVDATSRTMLRSLLIRSGRGGSFKYRLCGALNEPPRLHPLRRLRNIFLMGAATPPYPRRGASFSCRFISRLLLAVLVLAPTAFAQQDQPQPEAAQPKKDEDGRLISVPGGKALGMSILGNQEAPKALVIVPWKRSELGSNVQGISTMLDDSKQPIDKEVFMRMLSYYEIRSETARPAGTPDKSNAAQPNTAAQSPGGGGPATPTKGGSNDIH